MSVSSNNFDFLMKYDDRVARLAKQAERYVHTDPDSCLFKLRLMVEVMARALVELQLPHLVSGDLSTMLRGLQRSGLLERKEADGMHAIRREGNAAVHGEVATTPAAMRRLRDAYRLGAWYCRMIRRGSKVKLPGFEPPSPPPGTDAQSDIRMRAEMLEAAIEARRTRARDALMLFSDTEDIDAASARLRGELEALERVAVVAGEPVIDADLVALVMAMDVEQILEEPAWGRTAEEAKVEAEAQFNLVKMAFDEAETGYRIERAKIVDELHGQAPGSTQGDASS
jgi:type I restriction enzyme R subunit